MKEKGIGRKREMCQENNLTINLQCRFEQECRNLCICYKIVHFNNITPHPLIHFAYVV